MKNIALNIEKVTGFVSKETILGYADKVAAAQKALEEGTAPGNDFLGWLHLPSSTTKEFIEDIKATAQALRENCEVVVVAGIGGSYLGARAIIEALSNNFAALNSLHSSATRNSVSSTSLNQVQPLRQPSHSVC